MELFKVDLEWKDVYEYSQWEKRIAEHSKTQAHVRPPREFDEPPPARKHRSVHVAEWGCSGGERMAAIAEAACNSVVGSRNCWERYEVVVLGIVHVGTVVLAPGEPVEPSDTKGE